MGSSDNGAIYVVQVDWKDFSGGHVFIAENHDGETVLFDPQNPAADVNNFWGIISPRATRQFRVDDKPFTRTILEGVQKAR